MPHIVYLSGTFTTSHGEPVVGRVRCTPERLWVIAQNVPWASLAADVELDPTGSFLVALTPTDSDPVSWRYLVETPAGGFRVDLPWRSSIYRLKELIDAHHAVPWTTE